MGCCGQDEYFTVAINCVVGFFTCFVLLRWFPSPCKVPKRMLLFRRFRRDRIWDPTEFNLAFSVEPSMSTSLLQTQSRESCVPCFGACTESTSESRSQETKPSKWHVNHIMIMPSCRPQLNLEESSTRPSHLWSCFLWKSALSAIPGAFACRGSFCRKIKCQFKVRHFLKKPMWLTMSGIPRYNLWCSKEKVAAFVWYVGTPDSLKFHRT